MQCEHCGNPSVHAVGYQGVLRRLCDVCANQVHDARMAVLAAELEPQRGRPAKLGEAQAAKARAIWAHG